MPSAAHLLDVVRGIVSCASVAEMEESFHKVCEHMEVLRAKNSFADTHVEFGFRQVRQSLGQYFMRERTNLIFLPAGCVGATCVASAKCGPFGFGTHCSVSDFDQRPVLS